MTFPGGGAGAGTGSERCGGHLAVQVRFLPPPPDLHTRTTALPTSMVSTIPAQPPSATWFQKWPPLTLASIIPQRLWALDSPVGLGDGEGPSFNCLHLIFYFTHIFFLISYKKYFFSPELQFKQYLKPAEAIDPATVMN